VRKTALAIAQNKTRHGEERRAATRLEPWAAHASGVTRKSGLPDLRIKYADFG
jgi:hypothetical protein